MICFICNFVSNCIVYDCNKIICRLATKHELNNGSTSTPNEFPKPKGLINELYVPPCSVVIEKNTTMDVYCSKSCKFKLYIKNTCLSLDIKARTRKKGY